MRLQFNLLGLFALITLLGAIFWNWSPPATRLVIEKTDRSLDLAIVGEGYFELVNPDNAQLVYCRNGRFEINGDGQLVHAETNFPLTPYITIPFDRPIIEITPAGEVRTSSLDIDQKITVGAINISRFSFSGKSKLASLGAACFAMTDASGAPHQSKPGKNDAGQIAQGWLERTEPVWISPTPVIFMPLLVFACGFVVVTLHYAKILREKNANRIGED